MILANFDRQVFPCLGCPPCDCGVEFGNYAEDETPVAAAGGIATTALATTGVPLGRTVAAGVLTGVLIWAITHALDKWSKE